jgi:hypothetical protein
LESADLEKSSMLGDLLRLATMFHSFTAQLPARAIDPARIG